MLPNVGSNNLAVLWGCIVENPLDQVVAVLVACNIDQRNASTISAPFADSVEVAAQELSTANLEALLNYLGGELVGTILGSVPDDMVNGSATVGGAAMFADMLDAPVSKLPVSDYVDVGEYFLDARTLEGELVLKFAMNKK